ncbi:MAG: NAD-dependent epimerase/dehydratase family protein [Cypionkella sp.]
MARALGRVLVTGANGFIGAALVSRLKALGLAVMATDLGGKLPCDLTDFAQVEGVVSHGFDTIFHCGAVSGPMVMADRPLDVWRINANGTAHVLEAARRHGQARVVVCSTTEVYGRLTGAVDEETQPEPPSVYGASKLAAEAAVKGYVCEGVDAVVLRLSWVYGPGRRTPTTLESALRALVADEDLQIAADPADPTHYLWVDDAVTGLLRSAEISKLSRRCFNITGGAAVPMREVVRALNGMPTRGQISLRQAPPTLAPDFIDSGAAERELGFKADIPLEAGLFLFLEALRRSLRAN